MSLITKRKVLDGVFLVEIPEVELRLLCGCPADAIKHLALKGLMPVVKKDGVEYESGPNAVLLSDTLVQKGKLSNLSEFPVLHMFYMQGMILPDHPNNSQTPILIGKKDQVESQMMYIFIGNYGLVTEEEFLESGETIGFAKEYLRLKMKFAQGRFIPTDELMKGMYLEDQPVEPRPGVIIKRLKKNIFRIEYKNKAVKINLNLRRHERYKASYSLPRVRIPNHYFAIIHSGEGDGWDSTRPCLSSLILHDEKLYLTDAGPFITETLKAFSVKPQQIEGVFFTHVHDDHFAGLFTLINRKRKVKIFSTNTVIATIVKKLSILLSLSKKS